MSNRPEDPRCGVVGMGHCYHQTGKFAPATAPRGWAEFVCCQCGHTKQADNYSLQYGSHGRYQPAGCFTPGGWQLW